MPVWFYGSQVLFGEGGGVAFSENCCWCRCPYCTWGTIPDQVTITIAGVVDGGSGCLDSTACTGANAAYVLDRDWSSDCLWILEGTLACAIVKVEFCLQYRWYDVIESQWKLRARVIVTETYGSANGYTYFEVDINIDCEGDTIDCTTSPLDGLVLPSTSSSGACDWSTATATVSV